MVVAATNSATSSATQTASLSGQTAGIADNFNTFLQILITQLKTQSPLDPLDTNQFTQQLVQFSEVEQTLKSNSLLAKQIEIQQAAASTTLTANLASYVGKTIEADGAATELKSGEANWKISFPEAADKVVLTIRDASGNIVKTHTTTYGKGEHTFKWDGKSNDNVQLGDGIYSITVAAESAAGNNIKATTKISGRVDKVDVSGGVPILVLGDIRVKLSDMQSVAN